jgi:putative ABC transport system permease protein
MQITLIRWLLWSEWRAHPVRLLLALCAIALGIALGFGIHLINAAAFNEFSSAARSLSGSADLHIRARSALFPESVYLSLAQMPDVAVASPVLEIEALVPGKSSPLKILGLDSFQAANITPDLLALPDERQPFSGLMADTLFLSPAAMQWLNVKIGDEITLRSSTTLLHLQVAGVLQFARAGQRLAVMDIAGAQWHFGKVGQLSRIDIKLAPGVAADGWTNRVLAQLGDTLVAVAANDQEQRTASLSRAYRVNLNVLAMVALFTGAFLVFSTQALSVLRRRSQFALCRVIGMTQTQLMRQILLEGCVIGVLGSLLGLALGTLMASTALSLLGGDLGGGYFPGVQPQLEFDGLAAFLFLMGGVIVALLGTLAPAIEATRAHPAASLKAGSEDQALLSLNKPWLALLSILVGALLTQAPPISNLPLAAYLAIVFLLIGSIALMPQLAATVFKFLARRWIGVMTGLALTRLANAPSQASIALSGVLVSFSLMVAMAIMVSSFRTSVDTWLQQLLSADMYVRTMSGGEQSVLQVHEQEKISSLPNLSRTEKTRHFSLLLDPTKPAVAVIARSINQQSIERSLPLIEPALSDIQYPIWISEAMVDLYGWKKAQVIQLPLDGKLNTFTVAGVWRDYARQSGSIQMRLDDYQNLTGDMTINDMSLWIASSSNANEVRKQLQALSFSTSLEFAEPGEIQQISMKIFDRSFAITYVLEAVAIIIGLFGVAASFSSQTLARAKEFGMLRHLGVTRQQILLLLAGEGALLTTMAILVGSLLGLCISLILIFIVNPQSFHWTMQLHIPWNLLLTTASILFISAALTALISGRFAISGSALRAVKEDW